MRASGRDRVERRMGVVLSGCLLAFTVGCTADDLMGPGSGDLPGDGFTNGTSFALLPDPSGTADQMVPAEDTSSGASALVSAKEGGVVSWGRFLLEIPAGALSEDTVVEISRPDPGFVMCELEPHGLEFDKPVILRIDYGGTAAEAAEASIPAFGIYWFDETSGTWVMVGDRIDADADRMEAELEHFSKYGSGMEASVQADFSKYGSAMEP